MRVGFIRQLRAFTLRVRMTGKPHPDRGIFRAGEHALCGHSLGNPLKQPPQNIGTRNNTSVSLGPEQDHVSINNAVLGQENVSTAWYTKFSSADDRADEDAFGQRQLR